MDSDDRAGGLKADDIFTGIFQKHINDYTTTQVIQLEASGIGALFGDEQYESLLRELKEKKQELQQHHGWTEKEVRQAIRQAYAAVVEDPESRQQWGR
jgi:hypothetical protein